MLFDDVQEATVVASSRLQMECAQANASPKLSRHTSDMSLNCELFTPRTAHTAHLDMGGERTNGRVSGLQVLMELFRKFKKSDQFLYNETRLISLAHIDHTRSHMISVCHDSSCCEIHRSIRDPTKSIVYRLKWLNNF